MKKCCGQEVVTPYCPLCGQRIRLAFPGETLLQSLQAQHTRACKNLVQNQTAAASSEGRQRENYEGACHKYMREADKLKGWVDFVKNAIPANILNPTNDSEV